jgi:glycosyltransferase involved in cell wall biosynthesis
MLIVGEGPLRLELQELAESLGISDRTVFCGAKSPVEPWIAAMDTMLLSSDVEGLPNVLIEAQALGVPVVTTDAGGAREAVEDGVTGSVVTDTSTEALVEACASYLTSPERRARAEREGPGFVASRFGVERMVRETLDALGFNETPRSQAAE